MNIICQVVVYIIYIVGQVGVIANIWAVILLGWIIVTILVSLLLVSGKGGKIDHAYTT